jgi:hypothetical protein
MMAREKAEDIITEADHVVLRENVKPEGARKELKDAKD